MVVYVTIRKGGLDLKGGTYPAKIRHIRSCCVGSHTGKIELVVPKMEVK